ncbi:endolytic transglycosylase MltG [bacterium]|nr:MAG: endolytic transglycosylase MltG [bacterium]
MPDSKRRKRIIGSVLILSLLLVLLIGLEVFSRFFLEGSVADGPRKEVYVTIPSGASITEIASIMYAEGLIEHPRLFTYAVRFLGADKKIQAGTIKITTGQSLVDLIGNLTRAKAVGVSVTLREGLTSWEIAEILQREVGIDSAAFMAITRDSSLMAEFAINAPSVEGYLYPDTYYLKASASPRVAAARMVSNFMIHLPEGIEDRLAELHMTLNEVVTLASIIEWEVLFYREARAVSSVYHNRLKRGMLLQADPTIGYALGKGPSRILYRELKVDSPYNTYLYPGLPPGAINNPGSRAIQAALNPLQSNYLYFVAQGDGTHAFTTSLSEHLAAKQKLDRVRREQKLQKEVETTKQKLDRVRREQKLQKEAETTDS